MNSPALKVVEFGFRYPDGTTALQGINLEVPRGGTLAIVGPNGAGKSTLLLCLAGLMSGEGQIFIEGERLTPSNARPLRRKVGLVFQDPDDQLFMPVLEEDIAFGPANLGLNASEVEERVRTALQQLNLLDKRRRPPHHLSYGEKRRAALAAVLAMEPEILLLDEPTSNLDPATRREVVEHLRALPVTQILSTHDLDLAAALCSQCALLSEGRIVAVGPTSVILSDEALLKTHRLS